MLLVYMLICFDVTSGAGSTWSRQVPGATSTWRRIRTNGED